jgi:hypothetical protein
MSPESPNDHFGNRFKPRAAIGKALMVKRDAAGQVVVEQWDSPIDLIGK